MSADYGIFKDDLGVTGDLYRQQQRIADLERELGALEVAHGHVVAAYKRDLAAAQKIAEGYEQRTREAVALADKAVARAERREGELADARAHCELTDVVAAEAAIGELRERAERAEADSALVDWLQSKLNRGDWHIDFSHPDEIDIRVAIRRAMAAELGVPK